MLDSDMTRLFLGLATVTWFAAPSAADSLHDYCWSVKTFAQSIMEARQAGVSPNKILGVTAQGDPGVRDNLLALAAAAIRTPIYPTTAEKGAAVAIFAERGYDQCIAVSGNPNNWRRR
ncbi:hypothetical protein PAF17_19385 [Paracoccus sp. Z330]|uniref:Uncharacterized protein n=1 Tax=Paracoccus onchidii TaxID=3017813 RepID=A0ABT4ZJU7_9RHOB|nr:hypothetical protein [Paracoccus onchidii]MDB6179630.1 hypothetical protein [Paracoccus onchidii]